MRVLRTSCMTPDSSRRQLKLWRRSWKRKGRILDRRIAPFQAVLIRWRGLSLKVKISPDGFLFADSRSNISPVRGISRDSPSGVFEWVTKSSRLGKSTSCQSPSRYRAKSESARRARHPAKEQKGVTERGPSAAACSSLASHIASKSAQHAD